MRYVMPAANRAPTPSPTSTMIRAPVTRPKRKPPRPPAAACRVRWGEDPVARSAGRTPANTALATPSPSASSTTSGVTPRSTQNGRSKPGSTRSTSRCMPSRPTPVARSARTSVSTKSWATMRDRPAPSAVRSANSLERFAVRAKSRIATLPHAITSRTRGTPRGTPWAIEGGTAGRAFSRRPAPARPDGTGCASPSPGCRRAAPEHPTARRGPARRSTRDNSPVATVR